MKRALYLITNDATTETSLQKLTRRQAERLRASGYIVISLE